MLAMPGGATEIERSAALVAPSTQDAACCRTIERWHDSASSVPPDAEISR
ncbi:hypothetical protein AB5I41_11505 [Sphingomonas sp. MMS24-JH45]